MGRRVSSPSFVGRADELAWLRDAHAEAAKGRASVLLVGGTSGLGKTRLVGEFVTWAQAAGSRVLLGSCPLIRDGELPFAPITEVLRGLVREADRDELLSIVGPSLGDLRPLVPDLARLLPATGDEETTQARMYDGFLGVLERSAEPGRPVVLVVEDLHWADRATRELLPFVAQHISTLPVLLIGTYREDELRPGATLVTLLADIDRSGIAERRALGGMPAGDLATIYEAVTGDPPAARTVGELHRRTDGNPFLLEELIAARADDGSLPAGPPTGIREQVAGRIAALPAESQEVMRLAATIGRRSPHRLLAMTSRFPELILLAALRESVRQQVIVALSEPGTEGYAFRQGIFQEVLYDDLLPGERQANHRLIAAALEQHPELAWGSDAMAESELARHWLAAGEPSKALDAAVRAGHAARAAFAFAEAHRHFTVALGLLASPRPAEPDRRIGFRQQAAAVVDRFGLLELAAEAASLAGEPAAAVEYTRALAALRSDDADPNRRSRLHSRLGRYLADAGDIDAAVAEHERAADLAADGGAPSARVRALADLARTLERAGRFGEAERACTEAVEIAGRDGTEAERVGALTTLAAIQARMGRVDDGLRSLEQARRIRADEGMSRVMPRPSRIGTIVRGYAEIAAVLERAGALEEFAAASRHAVELAGKLGASGSWGRYLESNAAAALYYLGRWDDAERASAEIIAGQGPAPDASSLRATSVRARIDVGRGRFGEAGTRFEACRAAARGDLITLVELAVGVAELALWQRQPADALNAVQAGRERAGAVEDPAPSGMLGTYALRAAADLADHARARRSTLDLRAAIAEAEPWLVEIRGLAERAAGQTAGPRILRAFPETAEAEWLRATGEPAGAAWALAAERWTELSEPFLQAYARWREAEAVLAERGERARATAAAREAHRIATSLGAAPLLLELDALARRARLEVEEAVAPAAVAGNERPEAALGLTPREFEVLLLVADGRTNRQIAETLFITEKTAGHHVSNLLGKLGVASRVEAAALAHRLGLLAATDAGADA